MNKPIISNHKVNELIANRWSPRAFNEKIIEKEKIQSILEAARWAPSAFNEQPWRFLIGIKNTDSFNMICSTLGEWNQKWAGNAPLLVLNIAKKTFTRNGKANIMSRYDLGQAVAYMCIEAMHQGIYSHQMSGFDP